jgi:hypothetical protein
LDGHTFNESEMALFNECMLLCAQKLLDTADIVREAMLRQLRNWVGVALKDAPLPKTGDDGQSG